ncbi:hypothetical protein ATO10_08182 [Actibacterium atlanticum]|uniref:Uncharacterized protein n=2 Tax=Actibacterium atlanticum TaxID=1461693 RepID=A0A058ZLD4_9RHOB|nr:hypothetical protein ATO10_08182 [Actibacterium atlanticum]
MRGPRLKTEQANRHIDQIVEMSERLPSDFYELRQTERFETGYPGGPSVFYGLEYEPSKPIPEQFALIVGEALHNFRSALDHLASAIIRTKIKEARCHFPVNESRENAVNHGDLKNMEDALPGSNELFCNTIRPENDVGDHLWYFGQLNNDDKHNLIIPTVTFADIKFRKISIGNQQLHDAAVGGDASKTMRLIASSVKPSFDGEPIVSVEVSFGPDAGPFAGKPVAQVLREVGEKVVSTLDEFDNLMSR